MNDLTKLATQSVANLKQMASALGLANISKLKKQMEYANKIKSPAVILYGENEIKSGKPTLRNLSSGEEKSIEIKELVNEIKKII